MSSPPELDPPPDITALPDALLLHILSYLTAAALGRSAAACSRWRTLALDDEVWRGECRASFGLESKTDPSGGACASFVEAARHWTDFTVRTFGASQPPAAARATLAPLWQSAREAWGCVSRWAGDALPEAKATLGPPASATEWQLFVSRLGLEALRQLRDFVDPDLRQALHAAASGWYSHPSGWEDECLGLGGGFSAYNNFACLRLLPLPLVAAWTGFLRAQSGLPERFLVVAACFGDAPRLLLSDLASGDLLLGPISPTPHLEARQVVAAGNLRLLRVVPASEAGEKHVSCVTRGIRVTASALYAPEMATFAYSIRLALVAPGEEGHLPAAQRGFETAAAATSARVHGKGVVGNFPLLREGGWRGKQRHSGRARDTRDDKQRHSGRIGQGEWCEGVFVYQSLSGRGSSISFEGSIDFVPGSLEAPAGEEFAVAVPRFPLLVGADEYLF
ncbi:hypothetical protein EMIHUDRAFT_105940 [Emiliania huxleyi CCMP1516]|uniref:F-box domain-containing protein n=2 Tax=Emiliania huxleyi TaxID=2903 RepID=A0A0D3IBB6_EMIH1|nr:hypothetical protein EMIHUDRAFT_105940 [Emiliania huxleyi CCMP1516]EOD08551.1 hypothetical protein EMIHUDRAFT_105940 [Emiliania huxleyi CCMP1516]|eukprot:XP_005760980.1 hypothetical protein EMIHUDRAFT_105940 [Emiliania huxleyi CCMP1516]